MKTIKDIAWLAGLLEGEGCFRLGKEKYPYISVACTDRDTIVKAKKILGTRTLDWYETKPLMTTMWRTSVWGNKAIQWMMTLISLMSKRRKAKILEIVNFWKNHYYPGSGNRTNHPTNYQLLCEGRL